jgi:hypothetical protein
VSRGQTKIENYFSSPPKEEADGGQVEARGGQIEVKEEMEDVFFEDDDFPVDELFNSFATSPS